MIAKNVGIRRAHGEFILATNIDILFCNELFTFFTSGKMTSGKIYRVIRYDIPADIPLKASIDEQLAFCRPNVIRINHKYGVIDVKRKEQITFFRPENEKDPHYVAKMAAFLFTNGCGDFQLKARENWHALYGYPELDMYSLHLDSLLECMAYFAGITEEILPKTMFIYHVEHSSGWCPEVKETGDFENKVDVSNIPRFTDNDLKLYQMKMNMVRRPIIFNDANWGLHLENLPETIIVKEKC